MTILGDNFLLWAQGGFEKAVHVQHLCIISRGNGGYEELATNRFKCTQQGIQHETRQHVDI